MASHFARSIARLLKPKAVAASRPNRRRRAFLESLEPRYALTAPVAGDDNLFVPFAATPEPETSLVLNNDTDEDTLHSLLTIGEVNGTAVTVPVGTPLSIPLTRGTLTLNSDHRSFSYVADAGETGSDNFTYKAFDGAELSNPASVSVLIHPVTGIGDDVPASINEGEGLALNDLDDDLVPQTSAPGPVTYFWYVDANEGNVSPFAGGYVPPAGDVLNAGGSPTANLAVSWLDLNAKDITSGQTNPAILTLKVVDANGQEAVASAFLSILDSQPAVTTFTATPVSSGECGGSQIQLSATFSELNPLETNFSAAIDWDFFDATPAEPLPAGAITNNNDGTFTVSIVHDYGSTGFRLPVLTISGHGESATAFLTNGVENPSVPGIPFFVEVTGGGAPAAPTAEIVGAPLTSAEGTSIELTSAIVQSCGGEASYAWTVTKDGQPYGGVVTTANFSFTPDDDGEYVVSLVVTDDGGTASANATIEVTNVDPTAALGGATAGVPTQVLSFTADLDDVSSVDRNELVASIDWGDGSPAEALSSLNNAPTHAYASAGTYQVTVTVSDDQGTVTTAPHVVTISSSVSVEGTTFVMQPSGLAVTAPASDNFISFVPGSLIVIVDGVPTKFDPVPASVTLNGGDGNDTIIVDAGVTTQFIIHGGGGNDTIIGGSGNDKLNGDAGDDVLYGQNGDDILVGGGGRDIIVGGDGKDVLHGKAEDDILISGILNFGANLNAALSAIQAEWSSNRNIVERVANIEGWGCDPTAYLLNSSTVLDDNKQDTLTGDQGLDWFFANLWLDNGDDANKKDKLVDINLLELLFADDLDF